MVTFALLLGGFIGAAHLLDRQTHQRLNPGHIDAAGLQGVFVVETDLAKGLFHGLVQGHRSLARVLVAPAAACRPILLKGWGMNQRLL